MSQYTFKPPSPETPREDDNDEQDLIEYDPAENRPWIKIPPKKRIRWFSEGKVERFCVATVSASTKEEKEKLGQFVDNLKPEIRRLVLEFPSLFSPPDAKPPVREVVHHIQLLPGAVPAYRPPFMLGEYKLQCLRDQMTEVATVG